MQPTNPFSVKLRFTLTRFSVPLFIHLLNLLLVSLLAIFLAYWSWQIWLISSSSGEIPPEVVAEKTLSPTFQPSASGLKTQWFDANPASQGTAKVHGTIRLLGLFAASWGRPSHAIVSVNGSPAQTLTEGAQLASGEKIEKIHSDHLTLQRDGVSQRLDLDRKAAVQGLILPVNKTP